MVRPERQLGPSEYTNWRKTHLVHAEDFGIVECGLVKVLKRLGEEEEREQKTVDAAQDGFILSWRDRLGF